jgi:Class II Aldolase and Adducin N-terminal domain
MAQLPVRGPFGETDLCDEAIAVFGTMVADAMHVGLGFTSGTRAVLLANDGALAFGPDTEASVSLLVALEEAAEAELRAAALGGAAELPGSGLADVREAFAQELPRDCGRPTCWPSNAHLGDGGRGAVCHGRMRPGHQGR